jgi:hypothetical protein
MMEFDRIWPKCASEGLEPNNKSGLNEVIVETSCIFLNSLTNRIEAIFCSAKQQNQYYLCSYL